MGYFRGGVFGSKTALESAHEVEQPLIFYDSFSSDFYFLGSFLALMGYQKLFGSLLIKLNNFYFL